MKNPLIIYQTEDGKVKIETHFEQETVWLNQNQISDLFQKERSVITKHISNIFKDGELLEKSNVQKLHISGSDKRVKFYSLDVIISVGYRVKAHSEYAIYKEKIKNRLSQVEKDFIKQLDNTSKKLKK